MNPFSKSFVDKHEPATEHLIHCIAKGDKIILEEYFLVVPTSPS